jgi:hypothetical protein
LTAGFQWVAAMYRVMSLSKPGSPVGVVQTTGWQMCNLLYCSTV